MEKALAIQREVCRILDTDEVYLCGGAVRDLVMGNTPKDYDFTTSMLPDEMIEKVKAAGRRVYTIGEKFGTIGFKVPVDLVEPRGHEKPMQFEYVEVTTFRSEVYTSKSRKPEVAFVSSLDEDLARRDLTMNAMVLRGDGSIYDPFGGRLDIYAEKIVTVGLPKDRIQEDPLRMLRAARFAARYGFEIDSNFIGKANHLADRIYDVSVERWVQELDKLFTSEYFDFGAIALDKMGLLNRILPEIFIGKLLYKDRVVSDPDEAWMYVLQETSENMRTARYINTGICHRLKFSKKRTDVILGNRKNKTPKRYT